MCGIKCLNVGQFGRLQSYMGSRTSKWTLNTAHAEVMEAMASFGEFLPPAPREDDRFMGSFPAGFPFIFWNLFTKVKLKSNSFNSCTIYIIPSAVQCPSSVNERRHSTVAQRLSCAPTLYPKLMLSPSSWTFSEQVREAVQEPSEGAQFVWGAVQGGILRTQHSNSSVYTANTRSAPSPLRPCLPAYPEKSTMKKDGHFVLPNTTKHCVLEQIGACLLRKGASEKLG